MSKKKSVTAGAKRQRKITETVLNGNGSGAPSPYCSGLCRQLQLYSDMLQNPGLTPARRKFIVQQIMVIGRELAINRCPPCRLQ